MTLSSRLLRLNLKHTWTISRASVDFHDNIFVYLEHDGIIGIGEASFSKRYGESLESLQEVIESAKPLLANANPLHFVEIGEALQRLHPGQNSAKAALDMALMDWVGKKFGLPLFRLWGLDPDRMPISSFTIGIDTPEMIQRKIHEAQSSHFEDQARYGAGREMMAAVRVTDKPPRIDANEGWKSKAEALEKICWLAPFNVELIEQPLPAVASTRCAGCDSNCSSAVCACCSSLTKMLKNDAQAARTGWHL
jgi:L-alanine-DL-glutamate epimerase-like enolase superfamily enzyme